MRDKKIGILMLDTTFHRPIGDIGNSATFSFPIRYQTVHHAKISRVVNKRADFSIVEPFIRKAQELEAEGVKAIATSCGFLAIFQKEIQKQLNIPFFSSSLLQISFVHAFSNGPIGVLTASTEHLTQAHLSGVNAHGYPIVVKGMEDMPYFTGAIIQEEIDLNQDAIFHEIKQVTWNLMEENPGLKGIVLECTNMPPYLQAIRQVTDIPVFDSTSLVNYIYESVC